MSLRGYKAKDEECNESADTQVQFPDYVKNMTRKFLQRMFKIYFCFVLSVRDYVKTLNIPRIYLNSLPSDKDCIWLHICRRNL